MEKDHKKFKVEKVVEEAKDLKRIIFDQDLESDPGNYVMIWLPGVSEKPFSVMKDEPLELGVKKVGPFSARLSDLKAGDDVLIRGPYGNSFLDYAKEGYRKLIVCGGCGSVPMKFLSEKLREDKVEVMVGAGNKDELPQYFKGDGVISTTDDGSNGLKGFVTEYIHFLNPGQGDQFYICGPEQMMVAAAKEAEKHVDPDDIIISMERYMKCSRGICGACEMDGYRTCVDGPVFTYKELKGGDFGVRKRLKSGRLVSI